jgi:class 3 adenylate cyclase
METDNVPFELEESVERIKDIITAGDNTYEDKKEIPARASLTYTNGFYVSATALFVDIRESSELTNFHRTRVLAKLYRAFISEMTAIMNGNSNCRGKYRRRLCMGSF